MPDPSDGSNYRRDHAYVAGVAWGQLTGFGWRGYLAALDMLYGRLVEDGRA